MTENSYKKTSIILITLLLTTVVLVALQVQPSTNNTTPTTPTQQPTPQATPQTTTNPQTTTAPTTKPINQPNPPTPTNIPPSKNRNITTLTAGDHIINSPLQIQSNSIIRGEGNQTRLILNNTAINHVFTAVNASNWVIENLCIINQYKSGVVVNAIRVGEGCGNFTVSNVYAKDFTGGNQTVHSVVFALDGKALNLIQNFTINNCNIECALVADPEYEQCGIYINHAWYGNVVDCTFINVNEPALSGEDAHHILYEHNLDYKDPVNAVNKSMGGYNINGEYITIRNCTQINMGKLEDGPGIGFMASAAHITLCFNRYINISYGGLDIENVTDLFVYNETFINMGQSKQAGSAIVFKGPAPCVAKDIVIANITAVNTYNSVVYMAGKWSNVSFINCTFGAAMVGYGLASPAAEPDYCIKLVIENCNFSGGDVGVYLLEGVSDVKVAGCWVLGFNYGLLCNCRNLTVANNTFSGCGVNYAGTAFS